MKLIKYKFLVILILYVFVNISAEIYSDTITIYWEGAISQITIFSEKSLPEGVFEGALISGSLIYETDQSIASFDIMGNLGSGTKYRFEHGLTQIINIGLNKWSITGGDLEYFRYYKNEFSESKQVIGTFSDFDNSTYNLFPNCVDDYEVSIALYDNIAPLNLFSSYDLETAFINLYQFTSGGGFLNTRTWDQNDEIIEGYYLRFDIDTVSSNIIPEPSFFLLFFVALIISSIRKSNKVDGLDRNAELFLVVPASHLRR